jgi:transposase
MTKGNLGSRGEYTNTKELHPNYPEDCQSPSSVLIELLVIWDGNPIHRCYEVKAFLASPTGQGVHLEGLPAYVPELNPAEGVWNYLNRVELKNVICQHLGQLSYELGKAVKRLRQKPYIIHACITQAGLV